MAEDVWHEKKESKFWSGTQIMWCGIEADSKVVTSSWWRSVTCTGCKAAMAAAKAGKK